MRQGSCSMTATVTPSARRAKICFGCCCRWANGPINGTGNRNEREEPTRAILRCPIRTRTRRVSPIPFHLVAHGGCTLEMATGERRAVVAGDLLLLPFTHSSASTGQGSATRRNWFSAGRRVIQRTTAFRGMQSRDESHNEHEYSLRNRCALCFRARTLSERATERLVSSYTR